MGKTVMDLALDKMRKHEGHNIVINDFDVYVQFEAVCDDCDCIVLDTEAFDEGYYDKRAIIYASENSSELTIIVHNSDVEIYDITRERTLWTTNEYMVEED